MWAATCVTVTVRSGRVVFKMLSVLTLCRAGSTLEVTMVHKGNSVRAVGGGGANPAPSSYTHSQGWSISLIPYRCYINNIYRHVFMIICKEKSSSACDIKLPEDVKLLLISKIINEQARDKYSERINDVIQTKVNH